VYFARAVKPQADADESDFRHSHAHPFGDRDGNRDAGAGNPADRRRAVHLAGLFVVPAGRCVSWRACQARGVVALGFHITYWDGVQWRDPLSLQAATERQRVYDQRLTGGQVYTPQMVIDGTEDAVGSDRPDVLAALAKAHPMAIAPVAFAGDRKSVTIGAGNAPENAPGNALVLLVRYALSRSTQVKGGENAGRAATDINGVTALATLGRWDGKAVVFPIEPPSDNEGIAVLVQAPDGRIYGATATMPPAS
jgi:hypothetical protein